MVKPDTYEGTQEEWDEVMAHCRKVGESLINDFFDGEEALKSESFYRLVTGKPLFTKEEIEARVTKWINKEKEIWGDQDDTS